MQSNNKQKGGAVLVLVSVLGILAAIAAVAFLSYMSAYDTGNRMDNQLISIRENNQNIYAQGTQTIMEIAQVPTMYKDDLKEIVVGEIQGKYGKEGSKATVQFLRDRNINLSEKLYLEIPQAIKAFRSKFEANQTIMIDVARNYKTIQGSLWQGFWLRIAGFPKVNMADFKPITTDQTEQVYKAGKESGPLKLR